MKRKDIEWDEKKALTISVGEEKRQFYSDRVAEVSFYDKRYLVCHCNPEKEILCEEGEEFLVFEIDETSEGQALRLLKDVEIKLNIMIKYEESFLEIPEKKYEETDLWKLQKEEAIRRMKLIGFEPDVIRDYEEKNRYYCSAKIEGVSRCFLYMSGARYDEILSMVNLIEKTTKGIIYHVHHSVIGGEDCYGLFFVNASPEQWKNMEIEKIGRQMFIQVYVLNTTNFKNGGMAIASCTMKNGGIDVYRYKFLKK